MNTDTVPGDFEGTDDNCISGGGYSPPPTGTYFGHITADQFHGHSQKVGCLEFTLDVDAYIETRYGRHAAWSTTCPITIFKDATRHSDESVTGTVIDEIGSANPGYYSKVFTSSTLATGTQIMMCEGRDNSICAITVDYIKIYGSTAPTPAPTLLPTPTPTLLPTPAPTSPPTPPPTSTVITPALTDYTAFDEAGGSSNWAISGSLFTETSNIHGGWYCSADQLGTINFASVAASDYEWSVDAASADNDAVGLAWRVADTNNFYKYSHTNDGGGCRTVYKIRDGVRTELWRASSYAPYSQSYSTPYNFRVRAVGCNFVGYYNGAQDFDITDSDCVATGGVGLYAWGNSASQWNNMHLTALASTPAPATGASSGGGAASATGDPHLQNVHGQRFDLMKPGKHVLINIPKGESAADAMLRVVAEARRLGGCSDMYFQELNVTGSWAEKQQAGGYHYSVSQPAAEHPEWVAFYTVELKVVHGRTQSGFEYLNLYVKHLGRAGFAVGGLLGDDDHTDASTVPVACRKHAVALVAGSDDDDQPMISSAEASNL